MMLDRRTAITALAVGGALVGTAGTAAGRKIGATRRPLDVDTQAGRQRTFMMMRGALDEQLVTSWVSARYYGVIEDRMDPLFAVVSAVFSRHRILPDGSVEAINAEIAWFTDAETGKVLDSYRNPYTNKDVKVPAGGLPPSKIRYAPDLGFHIGRAIPGLEIQHEILPFDVRGDNVWVTERSRTAAMVPGKSRPFRYSESNTFHASKSALEAPGATRVPAAVSFTNICSWRPWLEMDGTPGHLSAIGVGEQNSTMDMVPPAWLEATAARKPDILKDPAAILAPLWNNG